MKLWLHIYIAPMENKQNNKNDTWSALGLAWELGYLIVVPLVLFALGGRFLDKKLGTSPWMLIAGMLVAIVITSVIVYKKVIIVINNIK